MDSFRLDGKRAVITGGVSGIGNAIARLFAASGAAVTLLDLDPAGTAAAALKLGDPAQGIACDVADEAGVKAAFAAIATTGPTDILVNCAGVAHVGAVFNTSAADFDRLYRINVRGSFLCMQAALEQMRPRRSGVIVNLASIAATAGLPDRFAYSMTKGAILAMTLSVARDVLADGIRCVSISPARVHTPFVDGFVARNYPGREAEMLDTLARSQPIGRMGRPDEVAGLALYLCSGAAAFITGVDYPIDGGFLNLR